MLLLMSRLFQVFAYLSQCGADLRIQAEGAEQALMEREKERKVTNKDLLKRVELMIKEKDDKEEEHAVEMEEVIVEAKSSATMAVCESKIKLFEDVANAGSWDLVGWRKALAKLTGKLVNISQDPEGQPSKVDGVEKTIGDDN